MMKRCFALFIVTVLAGAAALAQGPPYTVTDDHVFNFGRIPADFADQVAQYGGEVVRLHHQIGVAVATGLSDEDAATIANGSAFARDLSVQWIPGLDERQWDIAETDCRSRPCPYGHDPTTALFFPFQWDMQIIDADDAWNAGFEGSPNVTVAILDSGIDPFHQDLAGLVDASRSIAFVTSLNSAGPPWGDDNFHGTHVAGTVVSNGIGTSGVAPHTTLMAVKVCNVNGSCPFSAILAGILHAADNGADVINMSLGGVFVKSSPGISILVAVVNNAVNYAHRNGVLVVSSAGNSNFDLDHNQNLITIPCESGSGMCISATGPADEKAGYSNFGTSAVNVAAPGGNFNGNLLASTVLAPCSSLSLVIGACNGSLTTYLFLQGTSMSAPHVSGAAALLDAQFNGGLNASQLQSRLQQTADDLGKPGTDPVYGKGRINVCSLVGCQ